MDPFWIVEFSAGAEFVGVKRLLVEPNKSRTCLKSGFFRTFAAENNNYALTTSQKHWYCSSYRRWQNNRQRKDTFLHRY